MRTNLKIALVLFLISLLASANFWIQEQRTSERNSVADVRWERGGADMQATVHVFDSNGKPISGTTVAVTNNSGFNSAPTDDAGSAVIKLAELDVQEIRVGGQIVMSRPYAFWFGEPTVRHGLIVDVRMKLPAQPKGVE